MLGRPCLPRRGGQGNVPYTISVCLDTDSTMPISPSNINKLVPPDEKNGRLMPVFGIVFVTTAMFRIACSVTCTTNPTTSSAPNLSRAHRNRHAAQEQQQKQRHDQRRPDKTKLLTQNRKNKVVLRLRHVQIFLSAVAQPQPGQPA